MGDPQESLFDLSPGAIEPAPANPEHERVAAEVPRGVRMGAMSWSYPGWKGLVYSTRAPNQALANVGLTAYSKYPFFRTVEIDRSYYEPLSADDLRSFALQVPEDFRFVAKAHEDCVVLRFPTHARYGKKRGEINPRYLDARYAEDVVLAPFEPGLGSKLGILLFQFPPQDVGHPQSFADELHDFLRRLPKTFRYAVEIRNTELLTRRYVEALADVGAVHCHNAWTSMPDVIDQVRFVPPAARRPLVVRWLLRRGEAYQDALQRSAPFDRIVEEDVETRTKLAKLVAKADLHGVPVFVLIDNKAEGCAPESAARLARAIADERRVLLPQESEE